MNPTNHPDHNAPRPAPLSAPRRTRHMKNACLAYGAIVFASVAAAAAVLTDTVPMIGGGF